MVIEYKCTQKGTMFIFALGPLNSLAGPGGKRIAASFLNVFSLHY